MRLPVMPPVEPMLATLAHELPHGDLLYEPKWDGFRAIVFRDGDELEIGSRNGRPLGRYFPEVVDGLRAALPPRIVVDGELVIAGPRGLDFEALQLRLHPAASRVRTLAQRTPAHLVAFDLLALGDDDLRGRPLRDRHAALERALGGAPPPVHVTPATTDPAIAEDWFRRFEGAGLDGVMAKPRDGIYVPGERVMIKVKHARTADVVVGGFRFGKHGDDGKGPASLLLGLYDDAGVLHSVGVASGFAAALRRELMATIAPYREGAGKGHPWLDGDVDDGQRVPGGPSRWTGERDLTWEPLRPDRVAEVAYDHLQGRRFRHATRFVRWRPDRDPASCTYGQLETVAPAELRDLLGIH